MHTAGGRLRYAGDDVRAWPRRWLSALLWLLASQGCSADPALFEDLPPRTAQQLQQRLQDAGLRPQLIIQAQSASIRVPVAEVARAVAALQPARGLPPGDQACPETRQFLASPQEDAKRVLAQLACELANDGRQLPGVQHLRVRLDHPPRQALDGPAPPPRAVVLGTVTSGFRRMELEHLLLSRVPQLSPSQIRWLLSTDADANRASGQEHTAVAKPAAYSAESAPYASLGPLRLHPQSITLARWLLGGLLILNMIMSLAVLLLWAWARQRVPLPPPAIPQGRESGLLSLKQDPPPPGPAPR